MTCISHAVRSSFNLSTKASLDKRTFSSDALMTLLEKVKLLRTVSYYVWTFKKKGHAEHFHACEFI
jgi:hypothetical protein